MRRKLGYLCFFFVAGIACVSSSADEIGLPCHDRTFFVTGELTHYRPGVSVVGAKDPGIYAEEVHGKDFTAAVPRLEPGEYTVQIMLAEEYNHSSGQRLMNITCEGTTLAANLDVLKAVGFAHEYIVSGKVKHQGKATGSPLAIHFVAVQDQAKFNAISILDAHGVEVACVKAEDLAIPFVHEAAKPPDIREPAIYLHPSEPLKKRVDDLIRRMSLQEKVNQLQNSAPAIPRLSVPAYDYWSEALHGVAFNGVATVFPGAIGMAATWDTSVIRQEGDVVSTEARAKYNSTATHGTFHGLTLWSPVINIFRDPRWGRGQETYGEDPWLTSRLAIAYIQGLQGDDPIYLKAVACVKHFAMHSGPEPQRHSIDVYPPIRDAYETYLPAFEYAVRETNVGQVMSAYSSAYGIPAPASSWLLTDLLRTQWGFKGYVVSDCDAIRDIVDGHHYVPTLERASAIALKAGNDLNCGDAFQALVLAVAHSLVTESDIDAALRRVISARFRLGMFDPPNFPYAKITLAENDTPAHSALALQVARESMVLLKNNGLLPLDKSKLKQVAVIGANADEVDMIEGTYAVRPSHPITLLQGIRQAVGPGVKVTYSKGCPLACLPGGTFPPDSPDLKQAVEDAGQADVVIYVGGLNSMLESEEYYNNPHEGFNGGDRTQIELPPPQDTLLRALAATGKPVIFVNCSGSAIAMPWEAANLPAILQAWYPGENGGTAVADVLFGKYNPAGRLPVTFYEATKDLPDFKDYSMANRTYRYFKGQPLFAFGHGLSYTQFTYGAIKSATANVSPATDIRLSVEVKNSGAMDGDEVVQVYARHLQSRWTQPIHSLVAFRRIHLGKGEDTVVDIGFAARQLRCWDPEKQQYFIEPGDYEVQVGSASDDIRSATRIHVADEGHSRKGTTD